MIVAVASGKGGTGKTTVSIALAMTAPSGSKLLDCDVEEPNCALFLQARETSSDTVNVMLPEVDASLCNGCGVCSEFCAYNALAGLGRRILVFPELCHSCGGCALLCPQHAIREIPSPIGTIQSSAADGFELVSGSLTVGKAMSPPLIRAVKKNLDNDRVNIIDCPPGNSCPMTTAVRDADFVILVSEPTPFGLHDLKLAVDTVKELGLPHGIILNRSDSGDRGVHDFCRDSGIPLLLEIPESRHIAESYSRGIPMLRAEKNLEPQFKSLWNHIRILCSKELSS